MIDSHSHIYAEEFDADRDEVIARAREAGVKHIILPNENLTSLDRVLATTESYPGYVSPTIGLHPEEIHDDYRTELASLKQRLDADDRYVAIGEIGIDLYWDQTYREEQMEVLDTQLHWCKEKDLPFIIHCRSGLNECLSVMDNFGEELPRGVFHSFTETPEAVEEVRRRGDFYFGVNGIVTFKKSKVKEILPVVGLDRLLLETDSPYLAPVPHRGQRNESSFVANVCDFVAQQYGITPTELDAITTENVMRLFTKINLNNQ